MADVGVHRPPKSAARGLLTWAIDLWPYVNGKAITLGLNLGEMDAEHTLDVLHYFFEEDNRFVSQDHALIVSRSRSKIYRNFYDSEYKYAIKEDEAEQNSPDGTKPYVPPTDFDPEAANPFGSILDEPL